MSPEQRTALYIAIWRHQFYIAKDDDLLTEDGIIETAIMVLDRIADDRG